MAFLQLNQTVWIVPYIPHSCALVWLQEESPSLPKPKIHLSFTPSWFSSRMELDYGEVWHSDPIYRWKSFIEMANVLNAEFPSLNPGGNPKDIIGGLSQIHTCTMIAALFGQNIRYRADGWPDNIGKKLNDEEVLSISVPDFRNHRLYGDMLRQIEIIQNEWGVVEGELNLQGVLNTAFRLRGEDVFADMRIEPSRVHHLLDVVCDTMIAFNDDVAQLQNKTGYEKRHFITSNCVVNMISGEDYRNFIQPYDKRLYEQYELFGIHNCGWCVDAYAEAYAEIGNVLYLDFGIDSDLNRLKELFPNAVLTLIYNPQDMLGKSRAAITKELEYVYEALGDCAIILGSMDDKCPNALVDDFYSVAADIWMLSAEEMVPWVPCS